MSRLSTLLRLLAAVALLAAMTAFFYQPLSRGLERWLDKGRTAIDTQEGDTQDGDASAAPDQAPVPPPTFLLQVFSKPPQAQVVVDGKQRGATPAVTNISCKAGQVVEVVVDLAGYRRWQRKLPCLPGESAALEVKLER